VATRVIRVTVDGRTTTVRGTDPSRVLNVGPPGAGGGGGSDFTAEAPLDLTDDVLTIDDSGYEVAGAVATHSADTTSVHGIADTSVLATASSVATAVSNHVADTTDAHALAGITGLQSALDLKAALTVTDALDGRLDTLEGVDNATQAELNAHIADTTDAHALAGITGLQSALDLKAALTVTDALDGRLDTIEADNATQTELDAHVNDATAAHAATAIAFTPAGTIAATTVQAAIEEVASEAGGGGAALVGAKANKSTTTQTIPNSTLTPLQWDGTDWDTDSFWSSGASSRFTIPVGKGGKYVLIAHGTFDLAATFDQILSFAKNGTEIAKTRTRLDNPFAAMCTVDELNLAAGDYVEAWIYQTNGVSRAPTVDCDFSIRKVG
jgi:hypothetical protein